MQRGMVVFGHGSSAARIAYEVMLEKDWSTHCGELHGHREERLFHHRFEHAPEEWYLEGRWQVGPQSDHRSGQSTMRSTWRKRFWHEIPGG